MVNLVKLVTDAARTWSHRTSFLVTVLEAFSSSWLAKTVLHRADFDQIAAATGQACKWVVPAGSAD